MIQFSPFGSNISSGAYIHCEELGCPSLASLKFNYSITEAGGYAKALIQPQILMPCLLSSSHSSEHLDLGDLL